MSPKMVQNGIFSRDLEAERSRSHKKSSKLGIGTFRNDFQKFLCVTLSLTFDLELWPFKVGRSIDQGQDSFDPSDKQVWWKLDTVPYIALYNGPEEKKKKKKTEKNGMILEWGLLPHDLTNISFNILVLLFKTCK